MPGPFIVHAGSLGHWNEWLNENMKPFSVLYNCGAFPANKTESTEENKSSNWSVKDMSDLKLYISFKGRQNLNILSATFWKSWWLKLQKREI